MLRLKLTCHEKAVRQVVNNLLKKGSGPVEVSILQNPGLIPWIYRNPKLRPSKQEVQFLAAYYLKRRKKRDLSGEDDFYPTRPTVTTLVPEVFRDAFKEV